MKEGQVINISHIYSLNFRIAKQIIGCSDVIMQYILNTVNKGLKMGMDLIWMRVKRG